ncbi:MAG: acyl-CoA carboxylase subunit epsilon [Microcella sp.]|uniref:acyl-CoA carboxylase subunit epsilon n=1 Tax=Microcella sp. TaxID=1913979 RepID=UPI00331548C2
MTGTASEHDGGGGTAPRITVVAGSPTEVELAAAHAIIAAVLAEQHERGVERVEPRVDHWSSRARAMRQPLAPGPGAWAASRGMRD